MANSENLSHWPNTSAFCRLLRFRAFKWGIVCYCSKGQKILKEIYVVLDSSKKQTLGQFYVLKIDPTFVFWKNLGQHIFFLRFSDLYYSSKQYLIEKPWTSAFRYWKTVVYKRPKWKVFTIGHRSLIVKIRPSFLS